MYRNSVKRFREIMKVLSFYGFGYIVDTKISKGEKSPENLRKAFEALGPTFVKIGQILSTRPDLISDAYIAELSRLQDRVPGEPFEEIDKVFYKQFDRHIDDSFLTFEEEPLASASIAQVYSAVLQDGREVIVKIQRPEIYEKMKLDLYILSRIASLTKARFNDTIIDPEEALEELLKSTEDELNFTNEGKSMDKFRLLNEDVACIYTPYVVWELTRNKVITMERIHGFKIDNIKRLKKEGYDPDDVAKKLALSYFKQIFEDGFFHADPHPGNILVNNGKICYIDFGIMGRLSDSLKDQLNNVLLAVALRDVNKMLSAVIAICIRKGKVNKNKLYEDIDYLFTFYLSKSFEKIKISILLQEVFDLARRNNLSAPKDLVLLSKGTVLLEGVLVKICPEINILDIAIPYVESTNKYSLINNLDFNDILIRSYKFVKNSIDLPSKTVELADSIIDGRAKIQIEYSNLDKHLTNLNKMVNRATYSLILSSIIVASALTLDSNIGPKLHNLPLISLFGFVASVIMSFILLMSIFKSGKM